MKTTTIGAALVAALVGAVAALLLAGGGAAGQADAHAQTANAHSGKYSTRRIATTALRRATRNRRDIRAIQDSSDLVPVAWARTGGIGAPPTVIASSSNVLGVERCGEDPTGCYLVGVESLPADGQTACMGVYSSQGSAYGLFTFFPEDDFIQVDTFDATGPADDIFNMVAYCGTAG